MLLLLLLNKKKKQESLKNFSNMFDLFNSLGRLTYLDECVRVTWSFSQQSVLLLIRFSREQQV